MDIENVTNCLLIISFGKCLGLKFFVSTRILLEIVNISHKLWVRIVFSVRKSCAFLVRNSCELRLMWYFMKFWQNSVFLIILFMLNLQESMKYKQDLKFSLLSFHEHCETLWNLPRDTVSAKWNLVAVYASLNYARPWKKSSGTVVQNWIWPGRKWWHCPSGQTILIVSR